LLRYDDDAFSLIQVRSAYIFSVRLPQLMARLAAITLLLGLLFVADFTPSAPSSHRFTQQNSERESNQTSTLWQIEHKEVNCRAARPVTITEANYR